MKSLFRWLLASVLIAVSGQSVAMTYSQAWQLGKEASSGSTSALASLQNAAASGDINAVVGLGNYYTNMKRYSKAVNYYKRAVAEGSAPGEVGLASLYLNESMAHLQSNSQINEVISSQKFKKAIPLAKMAASSNDKHKRRVIGVANDFLAIAYDYECDAGHLESCSKVQHHLQIAFAARIPGSVVFYECHPPFVPNFSSFIIKHAASNLFTGSPYETKGKCYSILYATVIQVVDRHTALMKTFGGFYLASFGSGYAPSVHSVITGVAKSEGAFKYENTLGAPNTVPKVIYHKTTYITLNPNTQDGARAAAVAEQAQLVQDAASLQQ